MGRRINRTETKKFIKQNAGEIAEHALEYSLAKATEYFDVTYGVVYSCLWEAGYQDRVPRSYRLRRKGLEIRLRPPKEPVELRFWSNLIQSGKIEEHILDSLQLLFTKLATLQRDKAQLEEKISKLIDDKDSLCRKLEQKQCELHLSQKEENRILLEKAKDALVIIGD